MKKTVAIILAVSLIFSLAFCVANATTYDYFYASGEVYPESPHDYPNDVFYTWEYSWPSETDGLFITFSDETDLDAEYHEVETDWGISRTQDYLMISYPEDDGGWVYLSDSYYSPYFEDDDLSGKTFYIPSRSFRVTLTTDYEGTAYGFSFDRISPEMPENETVLRYHFDDDGVADYFTFGGDGPVVVEQVYDVPNDEKAFIGWSTVQGGEVNCLANFSFGAGGVYDIYAVRIDPLIAFEDSFSFFNGDVGSTYPAEEDYYMNEEHYNMMISNIFKNFGIGPIPGPILAAVLSTYPSWYHKGSCYGIAASVFLHHNGVIDFLEGTGAQKMNEVKLTADVISRINYYQSLSACSFLCENLAPKPGTANYSMQLKNMFEAVESGKPVLFSYYGYGNEYLISSGHTVVLVGAYTDEFGNHYLVADDSNYDYSNGQCHYFVIDKNFEMISNCNTSPNNDFLNLIGGFNWTADYEQFTSFDINGNGSPLPWYSLFFSHIFLWVKSIISYVV